VPQAWPLEFRQPRDWHLVLAGACFGRGDDADPAQVLSEDDVGAELLADLDVPDQQVFFQQVQLTRSGP
jgi:hypothetical protein